MTQIVTTVVDMTIVGPVLLISVRLYFKFITAVNV